MKKLIVGNLNKFSVLEVFDREQLARTTSDLNILDLAQIDQHDLVRAASASNPNLDSKVLNKYFNLDEKTVDYALLEGAAANSNASIAQLLTVITCGWVPARVKAASNPNANEELLLIATDGSQPDSVVIAALGNKNLTYKCYQQVMGNILPSMRKELCRTRFFTVNDIITVNDNITDSNGDDISWYEYIIESFKCLSPNLEEDDIRNIYNSIKVLDPKLLRRYKREYNLADLISAFEDTLLKERNVPTDILLKIFNSTSNKDNIVTILKHKNVSDEIIEIARNSDTADINGSAIRKYAYNDFFYSNPTLSLTSIASYFESNDNDVLSDICANPKATEKQLLKCLNSIDVSPISDLRFMQSDNNRLLYNIYTNPSTSNKILRKITDKYDMEWLYSCNRLNPYLSEKKLFNLCLAKKHEKRFLNPNITEKLLLDVVKYAIDEDIAFDSYDINQDYTEKGVLDESFYSCPKITNKVLIAVGNTGLEHLKNLSEQEMLDLIDLKDNTVYTGDIKRVLPILEDHPYLTDKVLEVILKHKEHANIGNTHERKGYSLKNVQRLVCSRPNLRGTNKLNAKQIKVLIDSVSTVDDLATKLSSILDFSDVTGEIFKYARKNEACTNTIIRNNFIRNSTLSDIILDKTVDEKAKLAIFKRKDIKYRQEILQLAFDEGGEELIKAASMHINFTSKKQFEIIKKQSSDKLSGDELTGIRICTMLKNLGDNVDLLVLAIALHSSHASVIAYAKTLIILKSL